MNQPASNTLAGQSNSQQTRESGYILLTLEMRVKRLQRFDLPPADLDHAIIRVGDSAQVVVVAGRPRRKGHL